MNASEKQLSKMVKSIHNPNLATVCQKVAEDTTTSYATVSLEGLWPDQNRPLYANLKHRDEAFKFDLIAAGLAHTILSSRS